MYYYEGMYANVDDTMKQVANQQESMTIKSHKMDVKLHSGAELQLEAKVHFNAKISLQERNVELHNREVYNEPEIELDE